MWLWWCRSLPGVFWRVWFSFRFSFRTENILALCWSPDGLCSLHQSTHKGDIIARAGQDKAATFRALRSPPFVNAPILSHFIFPIIFPSLIVPLSPTNNRPICPSSLAPASPPAALFSPSPALQWQVLIRELPRPLCYSPAKAPPLPSNL